VGACVCIPIFSGFQDFLGFEADLSLFLFIMLGYVGREEIFSE
jgi:hypothetical protein